MCSTVLVLKEGVLQELGPPVALEVNIHLMTRPQESRQAGQKADLIERVSKAPREYGKRVRGHEAICLIARVDLGHADSFAGGVRSELSASRTPSDACAFGQSSSSIPS